MSILPVLNKSAIFSGKNPPKDIGEIHSLPFFPYMSYNPLDAQSIDLVNCTKQPFFKTTSVYINYIFIIVSKGNLLETLPIWGRIFTVEADITVTKIPEASWTNVFHFTKGENVGDYGDRIPCVTISKSGYFYISSAVSGFIDYMPKKFYFDVGKKHHLEIQQIQSGGKIIYEMLVDGNTIYSGENTDPRDFQNVKLYVSDPWHDAFTSEYGMLKNLKYSRPIEGKQMTQNSL